MFGADQPMFPVEMAPPNNLQVGMVVEKGAPDDPEYRRGIVARRYKVGETVRAVFPPVAGDVEIRIAAGVTCVSSNGDRSWVEIPAEAQTTEERVRVAALTFEPLSHPWSERITPEKIRKKLDDLIIDYAVDLPQRVKDVFAQVLADLDELAEPLSDDDYLEWHLLSALLSPDQWHEATSGDWPESFDLAVRLAQIADGNPPKVYPDEHGNNCTHD